MTDSRYLIEYCPCDLVEQTAIKRGLDLDDRSSSYWDYVDPDELMQEQTARWWLDAHRIATAHAKHDVFGVVVIYAQTKDDHGEWCTCDKWEIIK